MLIVEVIVEKCVSMEKELIGKKERVEVHSASVVVPTREKKQRS